MKVGTKSVLFGAHAFYLHPWFVAWAWWRLYGFPWHPLLWMAFFVHDLGYIGCAAMDDEKGELHPYFGAQIMLKLLTAWELLNQPVFRLWNNKGTWRWYNPHHRWMLARTEASIHYDETWIGLITWHSRFLVKKNEKYGIKPSRLCHADKLAIALTPWWLYVPMTRATGEIREYKHVQKHKDDNKWQSESTTWADDKGWFLNLQRRMRALVESGDVSA